MVLRALKNCDLIGASWGVSAFGNEEHDRRAGRAFQPRGMDGRRSLATSWLGFFYAFVAEVNGSRSELYVAATLKIGRSKRKENSLTRKYPSGAPLVAEADRMEFQRRKLQSAEWAAGRVQ